MVTAQHLCPNSETPSGTLLVDESGSVKCPMCDGIIKIYNGNFDEHYDPRYTSAGR